MNLKMTAAAAIAALMMAGGTASAATVPLDVRDMVDDTSGPYVTVTCTPACHGIDEFGNESRDYAEAVTGTPANESFIESQFAALTGVDASLVSIDFKVDSETDSFSVGPGIFFIKMTGVLSS
ncbi:MAG: hypothetical protein R6V26_09550 [Roseovarius sp.]